MSNLTTMLKVGSFMALSNIKPSIKHLILHVTKECNMRCSHCFIDFDNPSTELTFEEIKIIARNIPELIWLDIGGGEPILREDLEDIIPLFRFQELAIPTNGWETNLITSKIKKIIKKTAGKLLISLSLEGMEKTNDEIRQPGSFKRTIETLQELKKIGGIRIKFNTVICEKNYNEIIELMYFVKDLNPDFHSILLLRGKPRDPTMRLPSLQNLKSLEKKIFQIQQLYDYGRKGLFSKVQKNYQKYKRDLSLRSLQEKRQIIPCLGGTCHLVIWSNGDVAPCELLPSIGNIRTDNFEKLVYGEKMKKAIASIKSNECYCTHDCNMMENILFNPASYFKLLL